MDFKTGKLHKIIREFEKGNGRYEINGIDLKNTVFLYREKAGAFIPIPKGNYKTIFNDNESILEVDDVINNKAIEFQIISVFDVQSYKYLEKYPELKMVVVQTNKIVDDINNIIGYLNSVGVKTDSKYQTQILTPLEPLSVWYMNAEGLIDTLPIDDFNKKFKEIIEKMSELADEKAQEQVKKRLDELKTEIENFKNKKISEVLKELKTEKDNSIKEIEKIKEKSKSELNSRMPEINNKFNGIAGGTINPTFIQDDGEKTEGQYYLDRPTGKLYRCIKTTSNAVNSTEYFKDMSLNSIVNRLENLYTTKEEKTKLSLAQINNVDLNNIIEPGFYTSSGWSNNIINIPTELNHNEGRAFYLLVFSLENGAYCQQILYSFKGLIFFRAKTGANTGFNQWRKINLI